MKVEATVDFNLLPVVTEQMIWEDWDCRRQADLLIAMANRLHNSSAIASQQIANVCSSIYETTTQEGQRRVKRFLETVIDYFDEVKEGEKNEID